METLWKATGLILISVILGLSIEKTEKDFAVLLSMVVCVCVSGLILTYMKPIIFFLEELSNLGNIQNSSIKVLIKSVGMALLSELSSWICLDAGNHSMGKIIRMLGTITILYISLPVYQNLLTLIREILGTL